MIIQIYLLVKFEKSYKNNIKSLVRRDYILFIKIINLSINY